jgi:hypothetical protein
MVVKRRGGREWDKEMPHSEWINTVQLEPDVISMTFLPITSLLNGVPGCGFLNHAINLYLRCKFVSHSSFHVTEHPVVNSFSKLFVSHVITLLLVFSALYISILRCSKLFCNGYVVMHTLQSIDCLVVYRYLLFSVSLGTLNGWQLLYSRRSEH